jgi:hypothetical protein
MATSSGDFYQKSRKTLHDYNEHATHDPSKSGGLCLPAFAVEQPDAIQFLLVNSAVLGCLQLLLDPMHKFPHRSDKWFGKFCPASRLSVRIHSGGLRSVTREDHGYGKDECLSL